MRDSKYIKEITIKLVNDTPLKIGNGKEGLDLLIDKATNTPMILGSSIAGAFKNYLFNTGESQVESIFGSEDNQVDRESKIYVFDSFGDKLEINSRTGIRRDNEYGTALESAKYDITYLDEGINFEFKLKIFAKDKNELEVCNKLVYKCINALITNNIRLGCNKTSGFGNFEVLEVKERTFNLEDSEGLTSYILDNKEFETIDINNFITSNSNNNFIKFKFRGSIKDSMIIKEYNQVDINGVDCDSLKDSRGEYIIPGSTIKGISRSYSNKILSSLGISKDIVEQLYGNSPDNNKNRFIGRIFSLDTKIEDAKHSNYNRIRVDRFTGGVTTGGKFDERRVNGNINFELIYKKAEDEKINNICIALISLFLRDLGLSKVIVGSSSNIGSGRFVGNKITILDGEKNIEIKFKNNSIKISDENYIEEKLKDLKELKEEN